MLLWVSAWSRATSGTGRSGTSHLYPAHEMDPGDRHHRIFRLDCERATHGDDRETRKRRQRAPTDPEMDQGGSHRERPTSRERNRDWARTTDRSVRLLPISTCNAFESITDITQSVLLRRVAEPSDSVPRFLIGRSADFVNGTTPHNPDVFCARIFRSKADGRFSSVAARNKSATHEKTTQMSIVSMCSKFLGWYAQV